MKPILSIAALSTLISLSSCAKHNDSDAASDGILNKDTDYAGMFFVTVDSSYSSSTLYYNDFSEGTIERVLAGESGDPSIIWTNDQLFFFNRKGGNSNYRTIKSSDSGFNKSEQIATPSATVGDPHGLIQMDDTYAVISYGVSGKIGVLNTTSGELVQELSDFDTGSDKLKAFSLHKADDSTILATNDGLSDTYTETNNKNSIFVLTYSNGSLTIEDQNNSTDGNQGISTSVTLPRIITGSDDTLNVLGLCGIYSPASCVAGYESLTKEDGTWTTSVEWDLSESQLRSNGAVQRHIDTNNILAASAILDSSGTIGSAVISTLEVESQTVSTFHSFPSDSSGFGALLYDDSSGEIYVGDAIEENGNFTIYSKDGSSSSFKLPSGRPVSGVLVN